MCTFAKRLSGVALGFAFLLTLSPSLTYASPMLFEVLDKFRDGAAGARIAIGLEDFEAFSKRRNQEMVDMGSFSVSRTPSEDRQNNPNFWDAGNGIYLDLDEIAGPEDIALSRGLDWTSDGVTPTVFTFETPINAFGVDLIDFGTIAEVTNQLVVTVDGGDPITAISVLEQQKRNHRFFGLIDNESAFSSITVLSTAGSDFVELDNVRFGATDSSDTNPAPSGIPLPATLLLVIAGLVAGGLASRGALQSVATAPRSI
jgi:hypothetical protein